MPVGELSVGCAARVCVGHYQWIEVEQDTGARWLNVAGLSCNAKLISLSKRMMTGRTREFATSKSKFVLVVGLGFKTMVTFLFSTG